MRRVLIGLLALLSLAWAPSAHAATTINTPAAGTRYGASMPIDVNVAQAPQNDIRLEFTYTTAGPSSGYTWTVLLSGVALHTTLTMLTATPADSAGVVSVTPSNGATGTALPEGTYSVVLKYTPSMSGGPETSSAVTGVVIDRTTQAPTLTTPGSSARTSGPINVQYTLPETASGGQLTFVKTGITSRVLTLGGSSLTAGSHALSVDTTNLAATVGVSGASGGTTLPDGVYDSVVLSYQDALGNPAATASRSNVVLDTVTQAPTFTSPSVASMWGPQLAVDYSLPEDAAPAHLKLIFTPAMGPATTLTLATAEEAAGAHTFFLDVTAMTTTGPIALIGGPASLADGTYSVELRYTDALGNPLSSATHAGVLIDTVTAEPTLDLPLAGTYTTTTVPVSYTLGEAAAFTSTRLEFARDGETISIVLTDATAGTHTLTLNRDALASSSGVLGTEGGTTLPDGTYTVRLKTQDVLSNTVAQTAPRTVVLSSPVVDPDPEPTPPTPDPAPATEPTPPLTNSPLPPVGRLKLKLASKAVKAQNRRRLTATFTPWAGARTYRFTAVIGSTTKTGACKTVGKKVVCSVNAPRKGLWTLTVSALGTGKSVLATGSGTTRVAKFRSAKR